MTSNVCSPWATTSDLGLCPNCPPAEGLNLAVFEDLILACSSMLNMKVGYLWPGLCEFYVRPCSQFGSTGIAAWHGDPWDWMPAWWRWLPSWGVCECGGGGSLGGRGCSCCGVSEIMLGESPIAEITEVKVDGVVLTPDVDYRLDDDNYLVRIGGHWPCFPAGTLVQTSQGLRPIESIQPGEMVLTHRNRWRRVTRSGQTGYGNLIELRGLGGRLRCTPDHQLWAADVHGRPGNRKLGAYGWREAAHMLGSAWATPRRYEPLPMPALPVASLDEDRFWWVVGRWLGDGHVEKRNNRVTICCSHTEADMLADALAETGWVWRRHDGRTAVKFRTTVRGLAGWLTTHFGSGARNKEIPAWMLGAPEPVRRALLDGYVSADGCIKEKGRGVETSVRTVSHKLALSCRALAATLGFAPRIYEGTQTTTHIEGRRVDGAERTYRVDWNTNLPGDPYCQAHADDEHLWGVVRSGEVGAIEVPVYDIEVEQDHSFVADGFVVHNCCQRITEPDTEEGTFSVAGVSGADPPIEGKLAALSWAADLYQACQPGECSIPVEIAGMVRENVDYEFRVARREDLEAGFVGNLLADQLIAAYRHQSSPPADVWSPDVGPAVRRPRQ